MIKFFLLTVFLFPLCIYSREASVTNFYYNPHFNKYTFKNWDEIKPYLTKDILRGNDTGKIQEKIVFAKELLTRIAKMELSREEADIVKPYLINFLEEYLNDRRFIELINSDEFINEKIGTGISRYNSFKKLPQYIIRTIAVLNPSQKETDQCAEMVKKVQNKELVSAYFYDLMNCILLFSSEKTTDKYLDNIKIEDYPDYYQKCFTSLRVYAKIKFSKDRNEAWEKLSNDFSIQFNNLKDTNTQEVKSKIYMLMAVPYRSYTSCHKNYYEEFPFQLYAKTKIYSEKYFLASQISQLLALAVVQNLIHKNKLFDEYRKLKDINIELLSYSVPENSKMESLKGILKSQNDFLIKCIQEKYPEFNK